MHRMTLKIWLVSLLLGACAGQTKKPEVPAAPTPPRDALAWLPEDATVAGQIVLAPFQSTPLWVFWQELQKDPAANLSLLDASKIQRVAFAGSDEGGERASFVAALSGAFAHDEIAAQARARNIAPEPHGLLTFYRSGQAAFAQIYPELVLVCSFDRVDGLAARATQGDLVKLRETPMFRSLAERLKWSEADAVVIGEDPKGELKARAERQAGRYGFAFTAQDIVRVGIALDLGTNASLLASIETTGEGQAQALKAAAEGALAELEGNLFVGLLGIRPLVKALGASQDKAYVNVGGTLATNELNRALERVVAMLGATLSSIPSGAP